MLNLREIFKPRTIEQAAQLLQQPDTVALAGGTMLLAEPRGDVRAVVDLSALGLAYIREEKGSVALGATTTLAELADSPLLRALANGIVAQAAHRSAAGILRNQGTLAGTCISEPDGILAVALVALDAKVVTVSPAGASSLPLQQAGGGGFLSGRQELLRRGALVKELQIPLSNPKASLQTVARTPRDKPIVSVIAAVQVENGTAREVHVALGGVSETATRALVAERELEGKQLTAESIERAARAASTGLAPRGDYRGSVEYRKEMAVVLARRALLELLA